MKIFPLFVLITFFVSFNCHGMDEDGTNSFYTYRQMSSSEDSETENMENDKSTDSNPDLLEETGNIAHELMRLPADHQAMAIQILDIYHKHAPQIDMNDVEILHEMQNLGILQNYYTLNKKEIIDSVVFAMQESSKGPLFRHHNILQKIHNHLQEAHAAKNFQFSSLGEMPSLSMEEENISTDKGSHKIPENKRKQDNEKFHNKTKKIRKDSTALLGDEEEKVHSDKITEQTLSSHDENSSAMVISTSDNTLAVSCNKISNEDQNLVP